jgi:hypothetical protein
MCCGGFPRQSAGTPVSPGWASSLAVNTGAEAGASSKNQESQALSEAFILRDFRERHGTQFCYVKKPRTVWSGAIMNNRLDRLMPASGLIGPSAFSANS